jgi:hypothetical protein
VGDTVGMLVRWLDAPGDTLGGCPWDDDGGGAEAGVAAAGRPRALQVTFSVSGRVVGVTGPLVVPAGSHVYPAVSLGSQGVAVVAAASAGALERGGGGGGDGGRRLLVGAGNGDTAYLSGTGSAAVAALDGSALWGRAAGR